VIRGNHPVKRDAKYTQITNFTDSVMAPALSPDGRMVAFLRTEKWWLTTDQIYVKLLPNGDPVQITHDPRQKYGLAFSPDGSQIAYTAVQGSWDTYTVSPLGGEPKLVMSNASGLTWLDEHRLLFSEIATGAHMGVVTATKTRSEYLGFISQKTNAAWPTSRSPRPTVNGFLWRKWTRSGIRAASFRWLEVRSGGKWAQRENAPRPHGLRMASGCTSALKSMVPTISGANDSLMGSRNRSPTAQLRRKAWLSRRTAIP